MVILLVLLFIKKLRGNNSVINGGVEYCSSVVNSREL